MSALGQRATCHRYTKKPDNTHSCRCVTQPMVGSGGGKGRPTKLADRLRKFRAPHFGMGPPDVRCRSLLVNKEWEGAMLRRFTVGGTAALAAIVVATMVAAVSSAEAARWTEKKRNCTRA